MRVLHLFVNNRFGCSLWRAGVGICFAILIAAPRHRDVTAMYSVDRGILNLKVKLARNRRNFERRMRLAAEAEEDEAAAQAQLPPPLICVM